MWALAMVFCRMLLPDINWKTTTYAPSLMDDNFGFFSWSALNMDQQSSSFRATDMTLSNDTYVQGLQRTVHDLVNLLPAESRRIIQRMFAPRPSERAQWSEVLSDQWVRKIRCQTDF